MTVLLVVLAGLVALGLAFLFFWAFWRVNHLDNNVRFFKWLGCEIKRGGRHRGARHPMGGYRCLDCFLGGDLEDLGMADDGYVDPRRRTYAQQRGGAQVIEPMVTMTEAERARQRATLEAREQQRAAWRAAPPTSSATPRPAATLRHPRSTTTEERIGRKQRAEDTLASMYHHQAAALTSLLDTAPAPAAPSTPDFSDVSSGHSTSGDFDGGGGDFGGGGASGEF